MRTIEDINRSRRDMYRVIDTVRAVTGWAGLAIEDTTQYPSLGYEENSTLHVILFGISQVIDKELARYESHTLVIKEDEDE